MSGKSEMLVVANDGRTLIAIVCVDVGRSAISAEETTPGWSDQPDVTEQRLYITDVATDCDS